MVLTAKFVTGIIVSVEEKEKEADVIRTFGQPETTVQEHTTWTENDER